MAAVGEYVMGDVPTTAEVVRMTTGWESRSDETRSSWLPRCGTASGTAMKPACSAPRKATM